MKELVEKVVQWGVDRGLDKVGHLAQAKYTLKETAELLDAYADGNIDKINDAIGDILVTLIVGASNKKSLLSDFKKHLHQEENTKVFAINDQFLSYYKDLMFSEDMLMRRIKCEDVEIFEYAECVNSLNEILYSVNDEFNLSMSLYDCLQLAYDEIKNRTGKMVNGQFIKDN